MKGGSEISLGNVVGYILAVFLGNAGIIAIVRSQMGIQA